MADAVSDAIAKLDAAIADATKAAGGSLLRATPPQLAPVSVAMKAALAATLARITVVEAAMLETAVLGVEVTMYVTEMITTANAQSRLAREAAALRATRGYLRRLNHNIVNVPG